MGTDGSRAGDKAANNTDYTVWEAICIEKKCTEEKEHDAVT